MWHDNVELLADHDLDRRSRFKLALQEVDSRFFLYVTGFWHTGWNIVDVTEPEPAELLRFVAVCRKQSPSTRSRSPRVLVK